MLHTNQDVLSKKNKIFTKLFVSKFTYVPKISGVKCMTKRGLLV